MLSNTIVYGIRAVIYIASKSDRKFIPISEISEKLDISFHFLTKILQKLTQKNILISTRGPSGGIAFSKSPETIKIIELVDIIDSAEIFEKCILGLPECNEKHPCPMHDQWSLVKTQIKRQFENTSIAELANRLNTYQHRL